MTELVPEFNVSLGPHTAVFLYPIGGGHETSRILAVPPQVHARYMRDRLFFNGVKNGIKEAVRRELGTE